MSPRAPVKTDERLRDIVDAYWDNRVGFAEDILSITLTDQQREALEVLDRGETPTVKSGHGTGKTGVEAIVILHYMCTRAFCRIVCTAPSKHQLNDVLWAELSKWHKKMNPLFRSMFIWTKEKFFHKDHPERWFAVARTATKDNPEAFQGFHDDFVLKVIDEASAVPDEVHEVLEGAYGIVETIELMCGNPTRLAGHFFESFHKNKEFYTQLTWNCLESPLPPPNYAKKIAKKYGMDSNMYRIRVLGEFPFRDGDSFIPYDWVVDAVNREIVVQAGIKKVFGVDVARFGDDETAIAMRQGDVIFPIHTLRGKTLMETANYVAVLANEHKPKAIFVDVNGLGAGVFDRLIELGFPAIPINVSELPATDPMKYRRLRDELWGNTRDALETGRLKIHDNDDGDLLGELTTPKYRVTENGKIVIESKKDMKNRGLVSPNKADAFNLLFAQPMAAYVPEDDFMNQFNDQGPAWEPVDAEAGY